MPLVATGGGLGVLMGLRISITAVLELLKGRTVKSGLSRFIGARKAEVVLGGIGILSLVFRGKLPSIAEIGEQAIEILGSIGEFVLGFLIGPPLAEIAVAITVVIGLILYRRYCLNRAKPTE